MAVDLEAHNQDVFDDLLGTIEASQGIFALLIAVCDDIPLRDRLIAQYKAELEPEIRCYELSLLRVEPSLRRTIAQLAETDEHLRSGNPSVVTVTGADQLFTLKLGADRSEQEIFFGYLQWTREAMREFRFPIVLWVTNQLLKDLSRHAPDFWSWRKGVFRFASRKTATVRHDEIARLRPALEGLSLPDDDEEVLLPLEDLKALVQQIEQRNPKDPLLATLYSSLGLIYSRRLEQSEAQDYQTEQATAIEYFKKAIELQQELEAEHPELATSLNNLAYLYKSQGRYGEAEPLYIQALSLYEHMLGEEHPLVATSLNNLALLYDDQGRYTEAESLHLQALALRQRLLGEGHPDVALSINNLAGLYHAQERYAEAEPLFVQALSLWQHLLGEEHPTVALSLNNLAALYDAQKRYSEAEPLYLQALALRQRLLGEDHPDVAGSLNNVAYLYHTQGRYAEAESLSVQALALWQRLLGEDHPSVATSLSNLAGLYESQGRYNEAEPLFSKALEMRDRLLGENHPATIRTREHLERVRTAMNG